MANLAIIPARGGSKRIPRKNIKAFLGKPIISYSIEAAIESKLFDEVMVSTDDNEIAAIASSLGAKIPFMRSDKNADDYATTVDVLLEVLAQYRKSEMTFKNVCCIYPTAPFVSSKILKVSYNKLIEEKLDSVFPVLRYNFPIQRSMRIDNNSGKIKMIYPEHLTTRSQDLELSFHDAGQFYWLNVSKLIIQKKLWTNNTGAVEINEMQGQDIDTIDDWDLAELKYELFHEKKNNF